MNTGNFWSKEEELQLLDEIGDKRTVAEIAKLHGRTPKAIEMRIDALIRKQYSENYTMASLMNLYNKNEKEILKILQEAPPRAEQKQQSKDKKPKNEEQLKNIEDRLERIEKYLTRIYKKVVN
jgi:translation initiation factor 2B subunit (eIF-2B alpha/beta/delta family)